MKIGDLARDVANDDIVVILTKDPWVDVDSILTWDFEVMSSECIYYADKDELVLIKKANDEQKTT